MRTIWRSVKAQVKKRRKEFLIDSFFSAFFWFIVHLLNNLFIVRITLEQVIVAGVTGTVLNLSLGGVYGQCLNWIRKVVKCEKA
jgi:uncharacterized membrane protein